MIYYLLLFWFIVSNYVFDFFEFRTKKRIIFFACAVPATLLISFRAETVGPDTSMYMQSAEYFATRGTLDNSAYSRFEPGFKLLIILSSIMRNPGRSLVVLSAFLTIFIAFYAAYMVSNQPHIVYALYFLSTIYFFNFGVLRQSIAISLIMLAVAQTFKGNYIESILLSLLACTFQATALLVVPLFVIIKWKVPQKTVLFITICTSVALLFWSHDFSSLFSKLGYDYYIDSSYAQGATKLPLLFTVMFLLLLSLFSSPFTSKKSSVPSNKNSDSDVLEIGLKTQHLLLNRMGFYCSCAGILICALMTQLNILYRLNYYLLAIIILLLPTRLSVIQSQIKRSIAAIASYGSFIALFVAFMLSASSWFGVFPYESVL